MKLTVALVALQSAAALRIPFVRQRNPMGNTVVDIPDVDRAVEHVAVTNMESGVEQPEVADPVSAMREGIYNAESSFMEALKKIELPDFMAGIKQVGETIDEWDDIMQTRLAAAAEANDYSLLFTGIKDEDATVEADAEAAPLVAKIEEVAESADVAKIAVVDEEAAAAAVSEAEAADNLAMVTTFVEDMVKQVETAAATVPTTLPKTAEIDEAAVDEPIVAAVDAKMEEPVVAAVATVAVEEAVMEEAAVEEPAMASVSVVGLQEPPVKPRASPAARVDKIYKSIQTVGVDAFKAARAKKDGTDVEEATVAVMDEVEEVILEEVVDAAEEEGPMPTRELTKINFSSARSLYKEGKTTRGRFWASRVRRGWNKVFRRKALEAEV
uniref:Uncharacterized protein n=1 Tax=Phaeomonas parva TaxID=124430 RepID=A0A6U4D7K4_9STRA|mmetsp:Transcript_1550/g.4233  ORF Transcript_1550/g.4233 Transcript_1550/m.4233 type:complete len:384 (+) Transcript_1550:314-1465(+)|eukprot:CAMPEP_0118851184 /NCGR_PEP_ID=MMETSP1163-20130328/714_1 /TAXON_ID=124430 /ORGANISM="Phaeomonas parva, Strain CCMP2877" /LENGTH=383 /DNA_ID=CAMNT_0006783479 /DNA_START=176 /DNA_END=1327 /DNA_ORIENTATION=+